MWQLHLHERDIGLTLYYKYYITVNSVVMMYIMNATGCIRPVCICYECKQKWLYLTIY